MQTIDIYTGTQANKQANKQTYRQIDTLTDTLTDRVTNKQTHRQTHRQTYKRVIIQRHFPATNPKRCMFRVSASHVPCHRHAVPRSAQTRAWLSGAVAVYSDRGPKNHSDRGPKSPTTPRGPLAHRQSEGEEGVRALDCQYQLDRTLDQRTSSSSRTDLFPSSLDQRTLNVENSYPCEQRL